MYRERGSNPPHQRQSALNLLEEEARVGGEWRRKGQQSAGKLRGGEESPQSERSGCEWSEVQPREIHQLLTFNVQSITHLAIHSIIKTLFFKILEKQEERASLFKQLVEVNGSLRRAINPITKRTYYYKLEFVRTCSGLHLLL